MLHKDGTAESVSPVYVSVQIILVVRSLEHGIVNSRAGNPYPCNDIPVQPFKIGKVDISVQRTLLICQASAFLYSFLSQRSVFLLPESVLVKRSVET